MIRIVLTGSESTGKTSLAARLAEHYRVAWVPEFVRDYALRLGRPLGFADHGPIAKGQMALEDEQAARGGRLLIQDTDLLSTAVYCAHYFGHCPPWIADAARARRPALYLLMAPDVPWVPDPARDRGDRRDEMHALFRDAVAASGAPWREITGDWEARFGRAVEAIDSVSGGEA